MISNPTFTFDCRAADGGGSIGRAGSPSFGRGLQRFASLFAAGRPLRGRAPSAGLNDRLLRDIGLTRADVQALLL